MFVKALPLVIVLVFLDPTLSSKFNPKVTVKKMEIKPVENSPDAAQPAPVPAPPNPVAKAKNCDNVNCMPRPVPAAGSPECRPRYDGDSCCPTWICASDDLLAKSLFDKDNNWVHHEYKHDMFDIEPEHHEDEDEDFEEADHPPKMPSESKTPIQDSEKLEKYAAKGKLDNTHNKNFINRMKHQQQAKDREAPELVKGYQEMKNNIRSGGKGVVEGVGEDNAANGFDL